MVELLLSLLMQLLLLLHYNTRGLETTSTTTAAANTTTTTTTATTTITAGKGCCCYHYYYHYCYYHHTTTTITTTTAAATATTAAATTTTTTAYRQKQSPHLRQEAERLVIPWPIHTHYPLTPPLLSVHSVGTALGLAWTSPPHRAIIINVSARCADFPTHAETFQGLIKIGYCFWSWKDGPLCRCCGREQRALMWKRGFGNNCPPACVKKSFSVETSGAGAVA